MIDELRVQLTSLVESAMRASSRINEFQDRRYWYPLSLATFGVEEIVDALDSMCTFRTSMWEKTAQFEMDFANVVGARHAVMVNSGSSADLLLAYSLVNPAQRKLQAGDEVLVPAVTWPTQIWSLLMAGLSVRLVDVEPSTLNISPVTIERQITKATRAVFVTHLMGNPCAMGPIRDLAERHNLVVMEDCCEALGATWDNTMVGNFGIGGSFSFFFSHHITTMEGGMITTNDDILATHLRVLRAHGWTRNIEAEYADVEGYGVDPRYAFVNWGFNVRPTDLQAGFGIQQLRKLGAFTERRDALAARFFSYIDETRFFSRPAVARQARPVWMALPVMINQDAPFERETIVRYLEEIGVETRPIVAGNIARQPVAKLFPALGAARCPGADVVHKRGFYLGLSPMCDDQSMNRLIECLKTFCRRY